MDIILNNFEGPFDVLLSLIKENEMDIYDIKIAEITKQYLDYLNEIKSLDLELTSEFIVMAARLIEIKSKLLLPKSKEETEEEGIDPRKELMEKLIEYKKFKLAATYFKDKEDNSGVVFSKLPEILIDNNEKVILSELLKNITLEGINTIYIQVMTRFKNKVNPSNTLQREIPVEVFRMEDKMQELKRRIHLERKMNFTSYIASCESKMEVVVSFLALLELIKIKAVTVYQDGSFAEILMERVEEIEEQ